MIPGVDSRPGRAGHGVVGNRLIFGHAYRRRQWISRKAAVGPEDQNCPWASPPNGNDLPLAVDSIRDFFFFFLFVFPATHEIPGADEFLLFPNASGRFGPRPGRAAPAGQSEAASKVAG